MCLSVLASSLYVLTGGFGTAGRVPGGPMRGMDHTLIPVAATVPQAPALSRSGWTATATSAETAAENGAAANVLDGSASTSWHSAYSSVAPSLPQSITIDTKAAQPMSGLVYSPRAANVPNGRIGQYEISVSADGTSWGSPVSTGTWADDATDKTGTFETVTARYVRLTVLTEAGTRGLWGAAAEINLLGAPTTTTSPEPADTTPAPAAVSAGSWSPIVGFPLIPAAAALLPNNRVLLWAAASKTDWVGGGGQTQTAILDLTTMTVGQRLVTNTGHDMFCPGVAILPDGRIMVTGGNNAAKTSIYDPDTDTWSAGPDMNIPRGYQSMTTLPNGSAFTIGGSWSGGVVGGRLGEVWMPASGWRTLANVPAEPIYTADPQGTFRADNHTWLFPVTGGRLLHAGPSKTMHWITTTGDGSITSAGTRGDDGDAMNGNAVMYDTDKILTLGGAPSYDYGKASARSYTIDVSGETPKVTRSGDLALARGFQNSVVLPDGQVLTFGGQDYTVAFTDDGAALAPELWNPETGTWRTLAAAATPRTYHSWALLLPDGRVISGGGGLCGGCTTNHPNAEIFTPPYLLNADGTARSRPAITGSPAKAAPGSTISVTTDKPVTSFSMVRYSEATHSVNNDQRRIPLKIAAASGTSYQLTLPSDGGALLPGPYMLFALDSNGTPSVSTRVMVPVAASAAEDASKFSAPGPVDVTGTANLAAGKAATQSSTAYGAQPSLAVDGKTDGAWGSGSVTHTTKEAQPWWQVDLGARTQMSAVRLWNRTDCCADRLSYFYVFRSTFDMTGLTAAQLLADPGVLVQRVSGLGGQPSITVPASSSARFVRIQLSGLAGSQPLSLAEVQVLGLPNLAKGKTATQSSVIIDGVPSRAADGNTDGNYAGGSVIHTDNDAQPWWQVDLGATSTLNSVALWNRTDCCADRLSKGTVFISPADMSGKTYAQLQADTTVKALPFGTITGPSLALPADGFSGRYVRVMLPGTNYLNLAEVQVFGYTGTPSSQNTAPVSKAGPAQTVLTGAAVTLDGSASSDADGNQLYYTWTQTAGPAVTLSSTTAMRPAFTAPASATSLTFSLTVSDGIVNGPPATTTVTVTAPSTPPPSTTPLVNVASGRTATQSSTAFGGVAGRAVDGTTGGAWADNSVTHTDFQSQPWWQVDLGSASTVRTVTLWNRTDCCADRLANGTVFVSAADMTGRTYAELQNDPAVTSMVFGSASSASLSLAAGDAVGRYVRVQLSGSGYLSLAEVQVLGPNLAAGRTTTQSSGNFGGVPGRAVDGNTSGVWGDDSVTHTDFGSQPWWQVDLAGTTTVNSVTIWNRTDCCASRINGAVVFLSTTDLTGRTFAELQADTTVTKLDLGNPATARTVLPAGGISARYVRVQLPGTTGQEALSLAEVQVTGTPPASL